jgi:hypothetical protein
VGDSVFDYYLGKYRMEMEWTRNGLRGWGIGVDRLPSTVWDNPKERLQFVLKYWVASQHSYFSAAIKKVDKKSSPVELACPAIAIGIALFVVRMIPGLEVEGSSEPLWMVGAIIAIDLFLAAGALLHHFHSWTRPASMGPYRSMLNIFENAAKSIEASLASDKPAEATLCIRALGKEALAENGDWVVLDRERPFEIPHP